MSKVVLITGASGGIGAATAKAFAKAGYKTALNYFSNKAAAENLKNEINSIGSTAEIFHADVSDFSQVELMFEDIKNALGEVSVLVNNAGIGQQIMFQDITPELWRKTFAINTDSVFN